MAARVLVVLLGVSLTAPTCSPGAVPPSAGQPTAYAPAKTAAPSSAPALPPADMSRLRVQTAGWRTEFARASVDLAEFLSGGPTKDGIPAIDAPQFESIDDAREWLSDRSPIIALEIDGVARGYPLAILIWHEIVNDTIAGRPVLVTFCPLCNTALTFDRRLDRSTYGFGTTGNLRFSDLVMYDRQTESWWQQATGEALVGTLTGARLTFLPSQIVSLADFEHAYPDGTLLSRDTGQVRDYGHNPYAGYDTVDQNPFLFDGVVDGRLPPKERVVTVGEGNEAIAYPYSELRQTGVATGELSGIPFVVLWAPGTASALEGPTIDDSEDIGSTGVFRAEIDGRRLTFVRDGVEDAPIQDVETQSTWATTGVAVSGELAGSRLRPVVHGDHFWFAWAAFAPQTTIWTAP